MGDREHHDPGQLASDQGWHLFTAKIYLRQSHTSQSRVDGSTAGAVVMMATECYLGTIPLLTDSSTLPLPEARCIPEDGICYTALSHGGGQTTAQVGCWPSQSTMKLAWLGVNYQHDYFQTYTR